MSCLMLLFHAVLFSCENPAMIYSVWQQQFTYSACHSLYMDDRSMFVEVAQAFGMNGSQDEGLEKTKTQLKTFGPDKN